LSEVLTNPYRFAVDDCTYESDTEFTDWVLDYAITSGKIQANVDIGNLNNGSSGYYDLTTANVSATNWILRFQWNLENVTQDSSAPCVIGCGLYSGSGSAGSSGSNDGSWSPTQDIAVIFASAESSATYFQTCTGSSASNFYSGVARSNLKQDQDIPDSYYLTINRYDSSGTDTIDYSYTANSDYTTNAVTVSVTNASIAPLSLPSDLRYIKIESWQHSSSNGSGIDSTVENIKYNNSSSNPCP